MACRLGRVTLRAFRPRGCQYTAQHRAHHARLLVSDLVLEQVPDAALVNGPHFGAHALARLRKHGVGTAAIPSERSRFTSPASSSRSTRRVRLLRESTTLSARSLMRSFCSGARSSPQRTSYQAKGGSPTTESRVSICCTITACAVRSSAQAEPFDVSSDFRKAVSGAKL